MFRNFLIIVSCLIATIVRAEYVQDPFVRVLDEFKGYGAQYIYVTRELADNDRLITQLESTSVIKLPLKDILEYVERKFQVSKIGYSVYKMGGENGTYCVCGKNNKKELIVLIPTDNGMKTTVKVFSEQKNLIYDKQYPSIKKELPGFNEIPGRIVRYKEYYHNKYIRGHLKFITNTNLEYGLREMDILLKKYGWGKEGNAESSYMYNKNYMQISMHGVENKKETIIIVDIVNNHQNVSL